MREYRLADRRANAAATEIGRTISPRVWTKPTRVAVANAGNAANTGNAAPTTAPNPKVADARSSWWRFQELKGLDVLRFLQELVALVNMLHILSYGQQGGWRVGGCDNVLDENNTGPTELVSASFASQVWNNMYSHGVGCTPSRPLVSASFAWQV